MHPSLERILSEDETARAGVDAANARARAQIETVGANLARLREDRLRERQHELDAAVASILAEGDRAVDARRAAREHQAREDAARAEALIDRGAEQWLQVLREGTSLGRRG